MQASMVTEIIKWLAVFGSIGLLVTCDGLASNTWDERSVRLVLLVGFCGCSGYVLFAYLCSVLPLAIVSGLVNTGIVAGAILWGMFLKGQSLDRHQKVVVGCALLTIGVAASRPFWVQTKDDVAALTMPMLAPGTPR
jgi:drug/metabolite transporter (DMT)-like permease